MLSIVRWYMESNVTATLATYLGFDRTLKFLADFVDRFPNVPMSLSCIGESQEHQETLVEFAKQTNGQISVATGSFGKQVSFSENWNAAINGVKTEKLVLIHNDMYIPEDFFEVLDQELSDPKIFLVYTTVEPINNIGFIRPGKIVADFGFDLEDFKIEKFLEFKEKHVKQFLENPKQVYGYGFYLAGFTESFQDVGGFDQTRFIPCFCEDDDLNIRNRLKGYRTLVSERAIVYHFSTKTTKDTRIKKGELSSNRNFGRKWGFEARFLWDTGYEVNDAIPDIGTEKIGVEFCPGTPDLSILNEEPIVDFLQVPETFTPAPEFSSNSSKFVRTLPDVDIIIRKLSSGSENDFHTFARLIGWLRFAHSKLQPGKVRIGNYEVEIFRIVPTSREDSQNYLSLQKSTKYE